MNYSPLSPFSSRHIGPDASQKGHMLDALKYADMDAFIAEVVPDNIRFKQALDIPESQSEAAVLKRLKRLASKNSAISNYIGQGYYACVTPTPILRNVLEKPAVVHALYALST